MSPGALSGLAAGLVFLSFAASTPSMAKAPPSPPGPARPTSQKVVIRPVPEAPGHYLLQQNRADTLFTSTGLSLRLTPPERPVRELQWGVVGARAMTPQPLEPREARFHQLVGSPENWKRNLPTWGALYYPQVSRGVDLWFEAQEAGVTYSLRAERGADLRQVRLEWRGAQALRLAEGGRALEVVLADGVLREEGLLCGQEAAGGASFEVPCRYREVRAKGADAWEYVIEVDVKEPGRPAWVDPTLTWNTFLGGTGNDGLRALAILDTALGDSFVVGSTSSTAVEPGSASVKVFGTRAMSDVFVTRFSNTGTVKWTTVLGGNANDVGTSIVFGTDGYIYIAGTTASNDFPRGSVPNAALLPFQDVTDGFIARLSSSGFTLDWVQFLGGAREDELQSLVLAPWKGAGTESTLKLFAAGWTASDTLPNSGPGPSKGGRDLFVSRIDYLTGAVEKTLIRSGGSNEEAAGITASKTPTADGGTELYVTGYTSSSDFPVLSGQAPTDTAGGTALVFKLDQELAAAPLWETFLGGQGLDRSSALTLTSAGRVMVVGTTRATGFPNPDNKNPAGADAFLASFDAQTGQRVFSTLVGGAGDDEGLTLAPGTFESFYIGGKTTSPTLPATEGAVDAATSGGSEGFVIRMGRAGNGFVPEWGSFVGGSKGDEVRALAAGTIPPYVLVIGGVTSSDPLLRPPMVVTPGVKLTNSGGEDMFLFSMNARDLTPPKGEVRDGLLSTDAERTSSTTGLEANWTFVEPETEIRQFDVSVGTAPGCNDVKDFSMVGDGGTTSVSLSTASGLPTLTPGKWYFVNVRATNTVDLSSTAFSNGIFVLLPDGGPAQVPERPSRPASADLCGQEPVPGPDGGVDGGDGGGGENPGPGESPLGFSCGTPGGPMGLVLLVVVAFALLSARRKGWN